MQLLSAETLCALFVASCIILFVSLLVFPKKVRCPRARKGAKYAWEFSRKCNLQHSRKYILLGNSLTIFQCSRGKHAQRSCDGQWRNDVVAKNNVLQVMFIESGNHQTIQWAIYENANFMSRGQRVGVLSNQSMNCNPTNCDGIISSEWMSVCRGNKARFRWGAHTSYIRVYCHLTYT